MEETKTSKINSVIAKFKALKRPYQIAIAVGIVAVIVLIVLLSSPKTPFDGLKDNPNVETIVKRYGKADEVKGDTLIYDSYKWRGYDGRLRIIVERKGYNDALSDWEIKAAYWDINKPESGAFTKLCNTLNRRIGTSEKDDYSSARVWHDQYGHTYKLYDMQQVEALYWR